MFVGGSIVHCPLNAVSLHFTSYMSGVSLDMPDAFCPSHHDQVQFVFGGTEFSVNCFRDRTGEKIGEAVLSLVQEVEEVD